jgi:hypothetical protein
VNQLNSKRNNKDTIILDCIKKYNYQYAFLNALFDIDEEKILLMDYYIKSITSQHKDIKKNFLIKQCKCPEIIVEHMSGNNEIKKMINNLPIITSDNDIVNSDEESSDNYDNNDTDEDETDDDNEISNDKISVNLYSNEETSEQLLTQDKMVISSTH